MNDKRMKGHMLIVDILDIMAVIVSVLLANYIRNGTVRFAGIMLAESTIYLYLILVYILVSFFRDKKKDFFKRG